jgi:RNA polymerase primary sigma factor
VIAIQEKSSCRSHVLPLSGKVNAAKFSFIPSPEFATLTLEQVKSERPAEIYREHTGVAPAESDDTYYPALSPLLTPEGEKHLFQLMNYCKYLIQQLSGPRKNRIRDAQIRSLKKEADAAREQIVNANVRLVASTARKYGRSQQEVDELVSEGHLILLNSVDKFDYSKGFRFSTYATTALQRHCFRVLERLRAHRTKERLVFTEKFPECAQKEDDREEYDPRLLPFFLENLNTSLSSRERTILCERFGLEGNSPSTLKAVADRVGLSKERVRQLQASALEKLLDLARREGLQHELDTCLA